MANSQNILHLDLYIDGAFSARTMSLANGSVTDATVAAGANISPAKLQRRLQRGYAQESATIAAAESRVIHTVFGTDGTVQQIDIGCVVPAVGDSTATVNVKKNGVSILSAAITLNNANAARVSAHPTISDTALAVGDVLEVTITISAGTGTLPKGVYCQVTLDEKPV
jgi:hypothetical protein